MHRKVKNWVSSREKCTKNTKKAEKTSFLHFSRSRSNSVTLKMLPKNLQSRNAQKRSLKHFCKSDGFRVIEFFPEVGHFGPLDGPLKMNGPHPSFVH